jgi:hypothetical protein
MRKPLLAMSLLVLLLVSPNPAAADARVPDWIGDCATSAWCHLVVRYTGGQGITVSGRIAVIDQNFQRMVFYIDFPNNVQKFDGYLFSWDKSKVAGTTYWGSRTFGFFATK